MLPFESNYKVCMFSCRYIMMVSSSLFHVLSCSLAICRVIRYKKNKPAILCNLRMENVGYLTFSLASSTDLELTYREKLELLISIDRHFL